MTREMQRKVWLELKKQARHQHVGWEVLRTACVDATAHIPPGEGRDAAQIRHAFGLLREKLLTNPTVRARTSHERS